MADRRKWIALGYNLPVVPSKNRVYVWRKLKEFGAVYYKQGVAVLPHQKEKLGWFAGLVQKIREMGGEASILEISFLDSDDEKEIITKFAEQSREDYQQILREIKRLRQDLEESPAEAIHRIIEQELWDKLHKKYKAAHKRDHFKLAIGKDTEHRLAVLQKIIRLDRKDVRLLPEYIQLL